jgi:histidinol-phosphate aminotransferase
MIEINKLVRKNVIHLVSYSPAREEYAGNAVIFMDANENPFGNFNRYPDPYQKSLKTAISEIRGIEYEKIFLGNGSDEIIDLCFRVFCNPGTDKTLIFPPTYGMYEVAAAVNDIKVLSIPLKDNFQMNLKRAETLFNDKKLKLIFICSPNNPTANCMNEEDIMYIIEKFRGIVVLDEAYIEFSGKASLCKMVDKYSNLIVLQTFSKALGLAAARIGMAFTNPEIIHYFNRLKPPYNISTNNQMAAQKKIARVEEYKEQIKVITDERERLSKRLKSLRCVQMVYPSDANFLLVKVIDATIIYNTLVDNGIVVRNRSSLITDCLRITVGTRKENNRLIKAMEEINL